MGWRISTSGSRRGPAGFHRHVVIKAVKAHLASHEDFVRMFLDEGRIAARIHHPNVVRIEELGEQRGLYYLVMEYVQGAAVSEVLASLARMERRMTPDVRGGHHRRSGSGTTRRARNA